MLNEFRFYIPVDIKIGHFGDVLPSQSWLSTEETRVNTPKANKTEIK